MMSPGPGKRRSSKPSTRGVELSGPEGVSRRAFASPGALPRVLDSVLLRGATRRLRADPPGSLRRRPQLPWSDAPSAPVPGAAPGHAVSPRSGAGTPDRSARRERPDATGPTALGASENPDSAPSGDLAGRAPDPSATPLRFHHPPLPSRREEVHPEGLHGGEEGRGELGPGSDSPTSSGTRRGRPPEKRWTNEEKEGHRPPRREDRKELGDGEPTSSRREDAMEDEPGHDPTSLFIPLPSAAPPLLPAAFMPGTFPRGSERRDEGVPPGGGHASGAGDRRHLPERGDQGEVAGGSGAPPNPLPEPRIVPRSGPGTAEGGQLFRTNPTTTSPPVPEPAHPSSPGGFGPTQGPGSPDQEPSRPFAPSPSRNALELMARITDEGRGDARSGASRGGRRSHAGGEETRTDPVGSGKRGTPGGRGRPSREVIQEITRDEVVRALAARMETAAREERFRQGKLR